MRSQSAIINTTLAYTSNSSTHTIGRKAINSGWFCGGQNILGGQRYDDGVYYSEFVQVLPLGRVKKVSDKPNTTKRFQQYNVCLTATGYYVYYDGKAPECECFTF